MRAAFVADAVVVLAFEKKAVAEREHHLPHVAAKAAEVRLPLGFEQRPNGMVEVVGPDGIEAKAAEFARA